MSADPAFALLGPPSDWTLSQVLRRQAKRHGEREFIRFDDGSGLTFSGFDAQADRVARALVALGLHKGDRVMCMLPNGVEFLLLSLASGRAGGVFVPVNAELKSFSLQHQLHNCSPRIVVCDVRMLANFDAVAKPAEAVDTLLVTGASASPSVPAAMDGARVVRFDALPEFPADAPLQEPAAEEIGCIMYTSGTTGPAKGVLMPHAHLALFSVPSPALELTEEDVYYVCMPLFHANALFVQVFASLVCGARVHCVQRFSPNRWLAEVRACGATVTNSLGVMTEMLHRSATRPDDHENPLRRVLAVPVAGWIGDFAKRFGVRVFQGYGMTECNMPVYATQQDPCAPGCCGTVRGDLFEVAILDPATDRVMPHGEVGEICVRPKVGGAFMQGYFSTPDKTVEAWRGLWFHTGDAGRLEGGTTLYFVDRIKDRIRRRGENVSAFEVEQVLCELPGVRECAVVGIRVGDEGAEQEIKACVVTQSGSPLTPVEVLQHCIRHVPRFAVPRFIEFLEALPRTPSNKVQKHLLRDTAAAGAWDREAEGFSARQDREGIQLKGASK